MITKTRLLIDKSGLKMVHLARLLNIDQATFSKIVSGDRRMNEKVRKDLSKILKVKEVELE